MEMILTPTDHLSPPSTTSRLSDSDTTSECDIDGMTAGRDGASISSFGSSSSPPLEVIIIIKLGKFDFCICVVNFSCVMEHVYTVYFPSHGKFPVNIISILLSL